MTTLDLRVVMRSDGFYGSVVNKKFSRSLVLVVFYATLATTKDDNEKTNEFPVEGSILDSGPEH
jgi:hypothetical protein